MTAAALPPTRWELTAPETYLLRYVDCGPRRLMPGTRAVWLPTSDKAPAPPRC